MRQPLMLCGKSLSGFPKHRSRMPEHILPSPQKARSAFPKSLSGTKEKSCPSHVWTYITGCQANTQNAHKQRICVREPLPSAVGRSRGVEDGREWIIMHILNAYRCKHVCFLEYIILLCADGKSRDAKFCVSQGGKAFVLSVFIACVYCYGLIGRRKILRLYWACAVIVIDCLLLHPSSALLQSVWFPLIPM